MASTIHGYGHLRVGRGGNAVARMVARLFLLPRAGNAVETRLIVTPIDGGEHWLRTFGTRALATRQYPTGTDGFAERIGPLEFRFRREPCDGGTIFRQVDAAFVIGPLRARLPRACAPRVDAREDRAGDRRVRIDVRVSLPLVGPILSYAGTIEMEETSEQAQRREPAERPAFARSASARSRRSFSGGGSGPRSGAPASDAVGESEGRSPSDEK